MKYFLIVMIILSFIFAGISINASNKYHYHLGRMSGLEDAKKIILENIKK